MINIDMKQQPNFGIAQDRQNVGPFKPPTLKNYDTCKTTALNMCPTLRKINNDHAININTYNAPNLNPRTYQGGMGLPPSGHTRNSEPTMITDFGLNYPAKLLPVNNDESINDLKLKKRVVPIKPSLI